MRGRRHSDETRAAVIAALLAGQGVNQVADKFGLDSGMVSRWKQSVPAEIWDGIKEQKKERLVDLVEAHLMASLKASTKVAEQAHNDKWRDQQSAENLAVFYGVLSDKAFRLIEIAGRVFHSGEDTRQLP